MSQNNEKVKKEKKPKKQRKMDASAWIIIIGLILIAIPCFLLLQQQGQLSQVTALPMIWILQLQKNR